MSGRERLLANLRSAGLIGCGAALLGWLGDLHWSLELFSHFRAQYLVGLLLIGLALAMLRAFPLSALCLIVGAANAVPLAPLFSSDARPSSAAPYRLLLQNVNTRSGDPERLLALARAEEPDILVLQEVNEAWITTLEPLRATFPHVAMAPREDNFGVALYSRWPIAESSIADLGGAGVLSIDATLNLPGLPLRVLASHPPPPVGPTYSRARNALLGALAGEAAHHSSGPLIVVGDLNVTRFSPVFRRLLAAGLEDSAPGFGYQPTWPRFMPPLGIPIDHVLYRGGVFIGARRTDPGVGSDHRALIVDFGVIAEG